MARKLFFGISIGGIVLVLLGQFFWTPMLWMLVFLVPFILIGLYDLTVAKHNVLHNYPVIGHLRYILEFISPNIRQYFIETNESGRPFNRIVRDLIYARAADADDTLPFGTQYDIMEVGYARANHSLAPKPPIEENGRVTVGGPECKHPYSASRLNVSAMSFGALSSNAIRALNAGANLGGFAHNTGEGGLSPYHLQEGGDIFWQIGTGYFGCRNKDGNFDNGMFRENAGKPAVKMVEIKLSQGAKPSHGGVLPAAKVDEEIARIRGVEAHKDVISPPAHTAFSTPTELMEFVQTLRDETDGKPVGFKLCIGNRHEFLGICKAILETGILPDFITIDGAEGGTGAAPVEYSNRLGVPIDEGLTFARNALIGIGKRDQIRLIASGKIATGFDMIDKISLGADMCNSARAMLFSIGCIQSLKCNTNKCPTGIATQDAIRAKAVNVDEKRHKVANYHRRTLESFLDMLGAMGHTSVGELSPSSIMRRTANEREIDYAHLFGELSPGALLGKKVPAEFAGDWARASATTF